MYCATCQTTPCQHLPGPLTQEATWLFSDEAERTLTSGAWSSLFEHLTAQVQEPDLPEEQKNNRSLPPSQETATYWIWAHGPQESPRESVGDRSGKWLVFVPANQVDRVWSRIKTTVEDGQLGGSAKVATAKKTPLQQDPNERVICVYTSDWTDEYDVRRVHAELVALGCTWPMSYKTDQDTRAGKYRQTGSTNIGVYRLGARDALDFQTGKYAYLQAPKQESPLQPLPAFRLVIELVPHPCWYSNLRKVMPRSSWDTLRRQVYRQYHSRCGICQTPGRLHCHEIWRYDDAHYVQFLEGFIALCEWCHHIKHLGLTKTLAEQGKIDYQRVVEHFLAVNGCRREHFEEHQRQAFAQWRERNRYEWETNLGPYSDLIPT